MNTNPPVCKCLRTKKMFIPEHEAEALAESTEPDAGAFYWCNRTLGEIGPDDQPVHVRACIPGRKCFEQ
jgi:hypothetical protein